MRLAGALDPGGEAQHEGDEEGDPDRKESVTGRGVGTEPVVVVLVLVSEGRHSGEPKQGEEEVDVLGVVPNRLMESTDTVSAASKRRPKGERPEGAGGGSQRWKK